MSWYVAKSLDVLLVQLNAKAPGRSRASDGSIGDAAHSARESDHNPTSTGQVCARDFTNDPAGGLAGQWLADALVASRDPRIKYVIFNHRIIDSRAGQHPWQWMPYSGANAHEHHVHVSVFAGALGDDTRPWNLGGGNDGEDDDMQLTDTVRLWDNKTDLQVGRLLVGVFERLAQIHPVLTDDIPSAVKDSKYKAKPPAYWANADSYGYQANGKLDALTEAVEGTNAKLDKLIEALTPKA